MTSGQVSSAGAGQSASAAAPSQALPVGTRLLGGEFTITRHLSAGGFGITYLAQDTTLGREIVIKECYPEAFCHRRGLIVEARQDNHAEQYQSVVSMFMHEARSVAAIRHPNIVGVHRVFEENGTAYMALDRIEGQDLLDRIDLGPRLAPDEVEAILLKLLDAIATVHDHDMLHRDISPDNVLLEPSGNPVLIDFGAARGEASRKTRAISALLVVKDGYSPQEFYIAGSVQTPNSDLYALAATFYHVISGKAPPISQERMAELAAQNPDPCVPLAGRFPEYPDMFLKGIDAAMRVLPQKRLQSAQDWIHMIERERSRAVSAAVTPPATDPVAKKPVGSLDKSLTRLIAETNAEVRKSEAIEPKPKKAAPPVSKPRVSRPEWIDEFNAETVNPETPLPRDVLFEPKTSKDEPNWIVRALEKQDRRRKARSGAVDALDTDKTASKPYAVMVGPEQDSQAESGKPEGTIELVPSDRPASKSAATGLVLILSALAIQLSAN